MLCVRRGGRGKWRGEGVSFVMEARREKPVEITPLLSRR